MQIMIMGFRSALNQQLNAANLIRHLMSYLNPYGFQNQLVQINKSSNPYILLIGPAGAGKTTLSKRAVLSTFQCKRYAHFAPLAFVDPQQPIDLKYLLFELGMMYFSSNINFNENQLSVAFSWLLANQHKVTVVLDGLDQARFNLKNCNAPTDIDVHKKYLASELLFLILSRKFLPRVRLILTSRPHSILNFDKAIQPNFVLYLDDLTEQNMKTLFRFYMKTGDVDKIIKQILIKSPRIQQLIYCPLFLRLVCHLYEIVGDEIWTIVESTANLFDELLTRLQHCAHNGSQLEENRIMTKLSNLAYNKTTQRSVVITEEDLSECRITAADVQDLMIGVHGESNSALVGPSLFYFAHQSLQVSLKISLLIYLFACTFYVFVLNLHKNLLKTFHIDFKNINLNYQLVY